MHSRVPIKVLSQLLTQQPQLVSQVIKSLYRKHFSVNYDYHFKNGKSAPPKQISLKITNKCNLRCKMCAQWGESGYNFTRPGKVLNEEVPFEVYKNLIDDVTPHKPIFYIWGGEPFLYKPIMDVLYYLKENNLTTTIVTNGIKLKENAAELVNMGLDGLLISLDGTEEVHNDIRGWEDCFQHLVSGLDEVNKHKKEKNSILPYLVFLITVSKDNADSLHEIFKVCQDLNADAVICYYSWFTNEEIGHAHTQLMEQRLDTTPTAWNGYLLSTDEIDIKAVQENVEKIHSTNWDFQYLFLPDLEVEQIPEYFNNPAETFNYKQCVAPWLITEIMPNGDVVTCRDYSDYVTGNIAETSIMEIWNNEKYQKFRNVLKDEKLLPICSRCCGLMGF
jgi:radical SAM protein with 4Fe4S-binding SPASM domain